MSRENVSDKLYETIWRHVHGVSRDVTRVTFQRISSRGTCSSTRRGIEATILREKPKTLPRIFLDSRTSQRESLSLSLSLSLLHTHRYNYDPLQNLPSAALMQEQTFTSKQLGGSSLDPKERPSLSLSLPLFFQLLPDSAQGCIFVKSYLYASPVVWSVLIKNTLLYFLPQVSPRSLRLPPDAPFPFFLPF